jgi:hypothetical protein
LVPEIDRIGRYNLRTDPLLDPTSTKALGQKQDDPHAGVLFETGAGSFGRDPGRAGLYPWWRGPGLHRCFRFINK